MTLNVGSGFCNQVTGNGLNHVAKHLQTQVNTRAHYR